MRLREVIEEQASRSEIDLRFVVDDDAKTLTFADDEFWRLLGSTAIGSAQIAMPFFMNTIVKAER
jgi:hypothetical protein